MSKQWEYLKGKSTYGRIEIGSGKNLKCYDLNELGKNGWELVTCTERGEVIFKREKEPIAPIQSVQPTRQSYREQSVPEEDLEF